MANRDAEYFKSILGAPVTVTSGYRDPIKNALVGGVSNSAHLTDSARDIVPSGMSMRDAAARLQASGQFRKVLNEGDHIHVSYNPNEGQNLSISDDDLLKALTGKDPAPAETAPGGMSDDQLLKALTGGGTAAQAAPPPKMKPRFDKEVGFVGSMGLPFVKDMMAGYASLEDIVGNAVSGQNGPSLVQAYKARLAELNNAQTEFEKDNPRWQKYGWTMGMIPAGAGGIEAAASKGITGLGPLMKSGIASGALFGGLYGAGTPTDNDSLGTRAENALTGAGFGAATGAALPVVGKAVSMGARGLGNIARGVSEGLGLTQRNTVGEAENMLSNALARDGTDSALALQQLGTDKPLTLLDVGGENVRRQGRKLVTQPGEAGEKLTRFLTERAEDQSSRVLGDIKSHLSSNTDVYGLAENLVKQRSEASGPLWRKAMDNTAPATSDRLKQFQGDPDVQAGIKEGIKLAKREALANGEQFVPEAYAVTGFDAAGDPIVSGTPTWRTWQAAKEGLDAKVESFRNEVTRQLPDTKEVRSYDNLRKALIKELDKLNPDYKEARAAWAGPSSAKTSMSMGESFLKADTEEIAKAMKGMSEAEKDFYRIGAARALQDRANAAADSADLSKRLFGNNRIRSQIDAVFGPKAADAFGKAMGAESKMATTKNFVLGGSNTANKLADFTDPGQTVAQEMLEGGLVGGPKGAVMAPAMGAIRRGINGLFDLNPNTAAALGDFLTQAGPDALPTLNRILEKQAKTAARRETVGRAAKSANALAAALAGRAAGAGGSTRP